MTLVTRKTLAKEKLQQELEVQQMKRLLANRDRNFTSQKRKTGTLQ